jgi:hypothetical protein
VKANANSYFANAENMSICSLVSATALKQTIAFDNLKQYR